MFSVLSDMGFLSVGIVVHGRGVRVMTLPRAHRWSGALRVPCRLAAPLLRAYNSSPSMYGSPTDGRTAPAGCTSPSRRVRYPIRGPSRCLLDVPGESAVYAVPVAIRVRDVAASADGTAL